MCNGFVDPETGHNLYTPNSVDRSGSLCTFNTCMPITH